MNSKLSPCVGALVLLTLVLVGAAPSGCGERVEAGLANAPSADRKTEPRGQHDVVSTGDEGCDNRYGAGGSSVASAAGGCPKGVTPIAPDGGPLSTPN